MPTDVSRDSRQHSVSAAGAALAAGAPVGSQPVRLRLLGGWRLDGVADPACIPLTVRRLVAFLGLRGPTSREELATALWPEATEAHAHGSLRTALWRLRTRHGGLVESGPEAADVGAGVRVDVTELAEDVRRLDAGELPERLLELPWSLLQGELVPGWYDEWLVLERERVRQLRLHALEGLAAALTDEGRFALALEAGLGAVRVEPLRESAHRVVVRTHLREGNLSEAVRHVEAYRRLLNDELGLRPSPALVRLLRSGVEVPRPRAGGSPG